MKDYLGKVSLTLDDIRKLSTSDQSHWFALRGTKTGSVELKIKILSEECEVRISIIYYIIYIILVLENNFDIPQNGTLQSHIFMILFLRNSLSRFIRFRPKVRTQPAILATTPLA